MAGSLRTIDHTGDLGFEVRADHFPEVVGLAVRGMFEILVDASAARPVREERIVVEESSEDLQLRGVLAELLYRYLAGGFVLATLAFVSVAPGRIEYLARGEDFDPARHSRRTELKAVTYHQLEVRRENGGWFARVIFDV